MKEDKTKQVETTDESEDFIMGVVKINEKGQVIIPVDLRKKLDIKAGNQLVMTVTRDGRGIMIYDMKSFRELFMESTVFDPAHD